MAREQQGNHQTRGHSVGVGPDSLVVAAHELKSPLALIRQLTLELEMYDLEDGERSRLLEQIRLTSERALRLSTDLTRAVQIQPSLFLTEPLNINDVCADVIREITPLYNAHQRIVRKRSSRNLPLVVANRDLLRRIVLNFADNALHYADKQAATEVFVRQLRREGMVRVGVRDRGPITPRLAGSRGVTAPTSSQYSAVRPESSGLGLWISQQFAEAIGSSVGMTRHLDGLSFYVDIPVSKQLSLL